jgi:hypothetical protein
MPHIDHPRITRTVRASKPYQRRDVRTRAQTAMHDLHGASTAWDDARAAEHAVLSGVRVPYEVLDIPVTHGHVRTFRAVNGHPPIVLVHGVFGALVRSPIASRQIGPRLTHGTGLMNRATTGS